jgi:hypothetical protein
MTWAAAGAAFETTTGVGDKPAGTVSGDLLLASFSTDGFNSIGSVGPPAWDTPNLVVQNITYDNQNLQAVTRTAGGAEPSTYAFTGVGIGCGIIGRVPLYTGGAIVEGTPGVSNAGNTSPISATAPAITVPGTNHDLWLIVALDQDTDEPWTPNAASSGMTLRATANIAGQYSCLAIFSIDSAPAGTTGTKTVTFSGGVGAAGWAAVLLAIPCTASGGGVTSILRQMMQYQG